MHAGIAVLSGLRLAQRDPMGKEVTLWIAVYIYQLTIMSCTTTWKHKSFHDMTENQLLFSSLGDEEQSFNEMNTHDHTRILLWFLPNRLYSSTWWLLIISLRSTTWTLQHYCGKYLCANYFPKCEFNRILPPCNYCHHPWCVGDKSYHKALLIMFICNGISDHAGWNKVFHYWDTKLSWICAVTWIDWIR